MKDDLVKSLLAHDVDEPVPEEHERRIRAGLGALLAAPAPPSQAPAPDVMKDVAVQGTKIATRVALGAALLGGVAGFALGRATAPSTPAPIATSPSSSVPPPPSVGPTTTVEPPVVALNPDAGGHSSAIGTTPATPSTTVAARTIDAGDNDTFDRERSLLDRARAALVRHDAKAAAQALDESEHDFPRSQHIEERDYLRIQVARERGETDRVRTLAKAFLAKYPQSLYRARVEPLSH